MKTAGRTLASPAICGIVLGLVLAAGGASCGKARELSGTGGGAGNGAGGGAGNMPMSSTGTGGMPGAAGAGGAPQGTGGMLEGTGGAPRVGVGGAPDGGGDAPDENDGTLPKDGNASDRDGGTPDGGGDAPDRDDGAPDGDGDTGPPECQPLDSRPCYSGPPETRERFPCKAGTQTCDSSGHWPTECPGEVVPSVEVCNGVDDDCNATIDDVPRAVFMFPSGADLRLRNSACNTGDDTTWLACTPAIQSYCAAQDCRTSGFGVVEGAGESNTVVCLSEAVPREVAVADLAAFGTCPTPGSTAANADQRFPCVRAIHRYCKQAGFVSGFGPVGTRGDSSWTVVCLPADLAVEMPTTFGALDEQIGGCDAPAAAYMYPGGCGVASKRLCRASGHHSGFGPVDIGTGYDTTIICVDE